MFRGVTHENVRPLHVPIYKLAVHPPLLSTAGDCVTLAASAKAAAQRHAHPVTLRGQLARLCVPKPVWNAAVSTRYVPTARRILGFVGCGRRVVDGPPLSRAAADCLGAPNAQSSPHCRIPGWQVHPFHTVARLFAAVGAGTLSGDQWRGRRRFSADAASCQAQVGAAPMPKQPANRRRRQRCREVVESQPWSHDEGQDGLCLGIWVNYIRYIRYTLLH